MSPRVPLSNTCSRWGAGLVGAGEPITAHRADHRHASGHCTAAGQVHGSGAHGSARAHESINEPVSSIGGFDRDILHPGPIGLQGREDQAELIAEALLVQPPVLLIKHDDDTVRGMEIDPRITPHRNLLSLGG